MNSFSTQIIGKKCCLVLVALSLWTRLAVGQATNDDFNTNVKDTTKWSSDLVTGHGLLSETNQLVEFRVVGAATAFDQSDRPWKVSRGPYTSDWEVQVDTRNTLVLSGTTNQQVGVGIAIDDSRGILSNEIIAVQIAGTAFAPQPYVGFMGRLGAPDTGTFVSALNLPVTNGAVRIRFNSATKVLTLFYDTASSNGFTWVQFGSFGINGAGGADANMAWGLGDTDQLLISIYGYAFHTAVTNNEAALDNFAATGLVPPLVPHNFAVTSLKAPKKVTLKAGKVPKPAKVAVAIQNLGTITEIIPNLETLNNLVTLNIASLTSTCSVPVATLTPPKSFPVTLKPKKSLKLTYLVTINCPNDSAAGIGHEDYRFTVDVDPAALDGSPDTVPANNVCPRPANAVTGDKGCGNKDAVTKQIGADVLTDVVVK